jgi:hypothetical protein
MLVLVSEVIGLGVLVYREIVIVKPQHTEGPKAREKFERTMTTLFQVPKSVVTEKIKKKTKKGKD